MQVFQLADKYKANSGVDEIFIDFGVGIPDINCVALCGSNLSSDATVTLQYSTTGFSTPDSTIELPVFSNFNQVWFLDLIGTVLDFSTPSFVYPSFLYPSSPPATSLNKRYWKISINDPDPQGSSGFELGYLYIGEYVQIDSDFPMAPQLGVISQPATSGTGQEYGSKILNQTTTEFTSVILEDKVIEVLDIIREKQNIDPVLLIPYEDSIDNVLYPPRYGVFSGDAYAYPMLDTPGLYQLSFSHRETF
jgi:hypothetical protein